MRIKVRCEIFFLFMTLSIIFCLSITPLFAQYPAGYGMYGAPYGRYPYYNQPYYAGPYAGYGYNQPYQYGGYPYQPPGYAPNYYGYGQPNYGGYYPGYNYSQPPYYGYPQPPPYGYSQPYSQPPYYAQPPYYGYSQPQYYGGYPYRQSSYYQPYPGPMQPGGYVPGYSYPQPYSYYSSYPSINTGLMSSVPAEYTEADVTLDDGDDNDEITVDKKDIIAIMLPGTGWSVDTDELDDDIVDLNSPAFSYFSGSQWWTFKAKDVGTTIIKIDCGSFLNTASCGSTFEVEITVEE